MTKMRSNATYLRQKNQRTLLQQSQADELETIQEREAMERARAKSNKPARRMRQYR